MLPEYTHMRHIIIAFAVLLALDASSLAAGPSPESSQHNVGGQPKQANEELTPEQKMQRRFPQPVRVGDLIGLPMLDYDDATIGYVRQVVRTPDGKILLIVPYSSWFGWVRTEVSKRPVAVPIETVAILGRQLNNLELSREDIAALPDWKPAQGQPLDFDEKTLIALSRR